MVNTNKQNDSSQVLEPATWLSDSVIWSRLGDFYKKNGKDAWNGMVPYQVTSNTMIARSYVETILAYLEDWVTQHGSVDIPCRIVEIGAGHGHFSLIILRALVERESDFSRLGVPVTYTITDLVESNVTSWAFEPYLKEWLEQDNVQAVQWDVLSDKHPWLGQNLDTKSPWIFIANYVFDSLPQEIFLIENGKAQRGKFSVAVNGMDDVEDPSKWQDQLVFADFDEGDLAKSTLGLLNMYLAKNKDGCILIPEAAIRCIKNFRDISGDNMLLLTSDKALSTESSTLNRTPEDVARYASYSMLVNFHALGWYFEHEGGEAWLQQTQQNFLASAAYAIGHPVGFFNHFSKAFRFHLDKNSPGDLYSLHCALFEQRFSLSLANLVSFLKLTEYDPGIFANLYDVIMRRVHDASHSELADLITVLPFVVQQRYAVPAFPPTAFLVGYLLQELKSFQTAFEFYNLCMSEEEPFAELLHNIGVCYMKLDQPTEAKHFFEKALALSPENILTQGWLYRVATQFERKADPSLKGYPI